MATNKVCQKLNDNSDILVKIEQYISGENINLELNCCKMTIEAKLIFSI